jgi:hypothetical protein
VEKERKTIERGKETRRMKMTDQMEGGEKENR